MFHFVTYKGNAKCSSNQHKQESIIWSQESQNREKCIFSVTHIETSVHPFPALQYVLTLASMEKISGQSNLFP